MGCNPFGPPLTLPAPLLEMGREPARTRRLWRNARSAVWAQCADTCLQSQPPLTELSTQVSQLLRILCAHLTECVAVRPLTLHAHVAQALALLCLQFPDLARLLEAKLACLRAIQRLSRP
jgi:hypothetical protein